MANHQRPVAMINPLYLIVLVTWCFHLLPTFSIACSCVYSHPQEHFCSSDFVATLSIQGDPKQFIGSSSQIGYLRYPVKLNKVFKGIQKTAVRKGFIYTGSELNSCTPSFTKNVTYLMTGRLFNGKPFVSLCNFISEWSKLTVRQKKGFRRNFARACGCKVIDAESYPFDGHNENTSDNQSINGDEKNFETNQRRPGNCHWETKWEIEFDCQGAFSTCTPISTIPDRSVPSGPPFIDNPDSNDVTSFYNHKNPQARQLNLHRQRNRSKLVQKCQWDPNPDYLNCLKSKANRKELRQLEREGQP